MALFVLHNASIRQLSAAFGLHLNVVHRCSPRCGTDVEGTHRQLRLTDGLRSDNADSFTDVDHVPTSEISSVTACANTESSFASDGGTHPNFVDTRSFEMFNPCFVEQRTAFDHHLGATGCIRISRDYPAEHALTQWLDHVAPLNERRQH